MRSEEVFILTCVATLLLLARDINAFQNVNRKRLDTIFESLNVEDKIYQMAQIDFSLLFEDEQIDQGKLEYYFGELGVGSLLVVPYRQNFYNASFYRSVMVAIQNVTKTYNRTIPVIAGIDSVHGANYYRDAAIFPQQLNIAATFNETNARVAGSFAARDTLRGGINWLFSPIIGLGTNPLWSRIYETFGEDPYVVGKFASELVNGIQSEGAAACGKHFIGYSHPKTGHDRSPSWIPRRHLYQYFVKPWQTVMKNAKPLTVMESYTEYHGVPNIANYEALRSLLRFELGFDGLLVTDYQEIENLIGKCCTSQLYLTTITCGMQEIKTDESQGFHRVATDIDEAVKISLQETSVDMSMVPFNVDGWFQGVSKYINDDTKNRIDESVKRILQVKDSLGMFDSDLEMTPDTMTAGSTGFEEAHKMATQSIILAKNKDNVLPIKLDPKVKIHVTGPTSDSIKYQSGGWTVEWQGASTDEPFSFGESVADAFKDSQWDVSTSCGVNILGDHDCDTQSNLSFNVNTLKDSDYIVVCIGEENYTEKPGDIRDLKLPQGQIDYVRRIRDVATQAKIIVVFFGGRPRLLDSIPDNADAILIAFLPGPTAGRSILEIVNGSTNPSAKLPITYPKHQDGGGVPYYSAVSDQCTKSVSGNPHEPLPHWIYSKCEVLYSFGHGLSYTTFTYSNLAISKNFIEYTPLSTEKKKNSILVTIDIQNTGNRKGEEVCYFFIFDDSRHVTPEYKRLIGFERVSLDVRQKKTISLVVSTDMLDYIGPHDDKHRILQIGQRFHIGVGPNTDCRNDDELCTETISVGVKKGHEYVPSCEHACKILHSKDCLSEQHMTIEQCYNLCKDSSSPNTNESGWGWNYVNCIESILYNDQWPDANQCNAVNSMCRNVFARNRSKSQITNGEEKEGDIRRKILAAILAGIFGTITIIYPFFKVTLKQKSHQARDKSGIEFGLVSQQENELI